MIYTRLAVTPSDPARREVVSAALFASGAGGLVEDGAKFVTVFEDEALARAAAAAAHAADDGVQTLTEQFDPGDWSDAWRRGVGAHRVGRFTIAPPWHAIGDGTETIVIDPAMGFGTGEHESTRLALALLQDVVREGDTVVDAGCGSAVLAIAAARLRAARVAAIDNDALAISNAEENVERNNVADRVTVIEGDAGVMLPLLAPVRVVVANIIASVLLELMPFVERSLTIDGQLVVGGILRTERDAFVRDMTARGWRCERDLAEGDWWSALFERTHS